MQTTAKWVRKELRQFITVYQSILEFSLEKVGLEVIIKHNKKDPDDMLDDINAKLIEVCENYLKDKQLPLDKFQLATIVMDLYSKTISELDEPFKVIAKESKQLVQEYLEKNKTKREALERIKKENESLEKDLQEIQRQTRIIAQSKDNIVLTPSIVSDDVNSFTVANAEIAPAAKPKKKTKYRGTWTADLLVDDSFTLPV